MHVHIRRQHLVLGPRSCHSREMLPLHCPPTCGVGSLCAKWGLWGGWGTLTPILVVILCQTSQEERRHAAKCSLGRELGTWDFSVPLKLKGFFDCSLGSDSNPNQWETNKGEMPGNYSATEGLKGLLCCWQCRSTLSPSINCPISPTALFQGAPGAVVSDHILLLCRSGSRSSPDQGCPRQTGRLWTKSSSSNFLNFSGSLWGIYHGLFCLQLNFGSDGPDLGI